MMERHIESTDCGLNDVDSDHQLMLSPMHTSRHAEVQSHTGYGLRGASDISSVAEIKTWIPRSAGLRSVYAVVVALLSKRLRISCILSIGSRIDGQGGESSTTLRLVLLSGTARSEGTVAGVCNEEVHKGAGFVKGLDVLPWDNIMGPCWRRKR